MKNFLVKINGNEIPCTYSTFSGGEVHIRLNADKLFPGGYCEITAHLRSSHDVMTLLMLNDAIERTLKPARKDILIPYLPYARQDRVCNAGEAHSLRIMCKLINDMAFDKVTVWDCHSDVGTALLDNCVNLCLSDMIPGSELAQVFEYPETVLISPDAGANKKVLKLALALGQYPFPARGTPVIRADKIRDTMTGNITGTEVYASALNAATCVIVDDICDGGRTFTELAQALKEKGAGKIILYVTHGIFSKGTECLYESGISEIWTANPWKEDNDVDIITVQS